MRISLLGELEVFDNDDRPVIVTGAKQRALLAMLALHPGQMVPADQLVEALWGEDPPPAVRNGLQGLVSKLRRLLGSAGLDRDARRRLCARRPAGRGGRAPLRAAGRAGTHGGAER